LAGKSIAEHYDPTVEEKYWRGAYNDEPYYRDDYSFDDYAPAYRLGGDAAVRVGDASFDSVETDLSDEYRNSRGNSRLDWEQARPAVQAAWNRVRREPVNQGTGVQGEGDYKAAREFDEAERKFVASGKVPSAARAAAPKSQAEEREMLEAEEAGKRRAKP
jgi:hypothetical protein